jgi:hypothetical protein
MGMKNVLAAEVMDRLLFGEQQFSKRDRQRFQRLLNEGQLASGIALGPGKRPYTASGRPGRGKGRARLRWPRGGHHARRMIPARTEPAGNRAPAILTEGRPRFARKQFTTRLCLSDSTVPVESPQSIASCLRSCRGTTSQPAKYHSAPDMLQLRAESNTTWVGDRDEVLA